MKVELISHTPDAVELLIFTKSTRLQSDTTLEDIKVWPEWKKMEHLDYMRGTIRSSWEFVDYVFKISEVTRAFTHQLVRTRTGSYAQESQRTVEAQGFVTPDAFDHNEALQFSDYAQDAFVNYQSLITEGIPIQDARGILPIATATSIIVKWNLRTIHDTAKLRLCFRTQGEYQEVFRLMREAILEVHPWAEDFIQVFCVEHGHCMFPHYKDCPIKKQLPELFNGRDDWKNEAIATVWDATSHEATPKLIGKEGMTK